MNLVIVESPAKAKTINKYLGDNYTVLASYGHIRDLPSKNGSVDPDNNFKMLWEVDSFSKKYLKEITEVAKESSKIILATDPDREGEAIAWHVKEFLDEKKILKDKKIERVVFNEITKKAVTKGIDNPRQIEPLLVDAYMARRALDYLVGFNISPILWTKLPGSKSAGRVQSVALKLITEREHEIESFNPEEFWTLDIMFSDTKNSFKTSIFQLNGKKIEKFSFKNKEEINQAIEKIKLNNYNVTEITTKVVNRNPSGPFTTSTMQQVSSGKLGFGASRTMQIAQKLYQGIEIEGETIGLITYMRTDGTNISNDAIITFRDYIEKEYGKEYLPSDPLNYSGKKAKNAQEAHEAIRPTDIMRTPNNIKKYLSTDQYKLYDLIWSRALSSQMESAKFDRNTIIIASEKNETIFKATGSLIKFDGFLKIIKDSKKDNDENILPEVTKGKVNIETFLDEQHFTQPPPRYSEASLVKKLEELGIGRPSTYASIISVISTRGYAETISKRFHPTDRGKLISAFLEKLFAKYVDYNFTASLENQLDDITSGKEGWIKVLEMFWKDFNQNVTKVKEIRTREVLDLLNDSLGSLIFEKDKKGNINRKCKLCENGSLSLKNSFRGGAFIGCSNYPDCKFTRPLSKVKAAQQSQLAEPKLIGHHENGNEMFLKNGRFGPYIQYEAIQEIIQEPVVQKKSKKKKSKKKKENDNRKNVSIPKGISIETINLERAKFLCSLPKSLGINPENQKEIFLNSGRFGPYLKCENKSARIENVEEIFSIGLNRAITLIADAKPGRMSSSIIKDLGEHPEDKKPVKIMKGQYGPYIKYKSLNATIPEEKDPLELNMEDALILIEKRREYDKNKKKKKR
ncbi:MAG: DNA topoisomerase I [Candidatus Pelagibacter sp. TMED64]|nr:DNA topoisomerase I [Candidatus Pelagibacter sp.]OUU67108.1 MAG: DNA topoisomerase I [Candidatus Pelagibacter sp. TMED64]|tara:strand:+ start:2652 stop:5225 length:2574 start_codon:yes stop_codon:yes gene_type:complete